MITPYTDEPPSPPLPSPVVQLHRQIEALRCENRRLRAAQGSPFIEPVSGLPDGRYFFLRLGQELARTERTGLPFSLVVVEMTELRRIDEIAGRRHGHAVLHWAIDLLGQQTRECDVLCRIGHNELALLLPDTPLAGAETLIERLSRRAADHEDKPHLPTGWDPGLRFGAASGRLDGETAIELVMTAEERMLTKVDLGEARRDERAA